MYDFKAICATVDLRKLITGDIGFPDGFGRWDCPFCGEGPDRPPWCGDAPNLCVTRDNRGWYCRDCKAKGNALTWITRRFGIDVLKAARKLVPDIEKFRCKTEPRPHREGNGKNGKAHAADCERKPNKVWNPDQAWNNREHRIAESNIRHAGLRSEFAWAQASGDVAEMRGEADPEAAWRGYLDKNPAVRAPMPGPWSARP